MILRKIRSAFLKIYKFSRCKIVIFGFRYFQEGITIGSNVYIEKGVRLNSTDGGVINIASNAYIGGHSSLIARGGKIEIGKNVFIAHGCILVSQSTIVNRGSSLKVVQLFDTGHFQVGRYFH